MVPRAVAVLREQVLRRAQAVPPQQMVLAVLRLRRVLVEPMALAEPMVQVVLAVRRVPREVVAQVLPRGQAELRQVVVLAERMVVRVRRAKAEQVVLRAVVVLRERRQRMVLVEPRARRGQVVQVLHRAVVELVVPPQVRVRRVLRALAEQVDKMVLRVDWFTT